MRASIILEGLKGIIMEHSLCFNFEMTNNQIEYDALIARLKLAKDMGVKFLITTSDL